MNPASVSLIDRLCEVESPYDLEDWEQREPYYVAAGRVSSEDVPDLIDLARKWTDPDWPFDTDSLSIDISESEEVDAELLPVTAWRTLAELKAEAAVEPLIDMLRELEDEGDDWATEELPHVFGKIGDPSTEPLLRLARDSQAGSFARHVATRGLSLVAKYHPHMRDRIVAHLTQLMADATGKVDASDETDESEIHFNSSVLVGLADLQAVEAAEPIERAFAANLLDIGMMGDWQVVRQKLGVEGLGLAMPEEPYNSIDQIQIGMGIGIFSDKALFNFDEPDYDAVQDYYERAHDTFSKSTEAQRVVSQYGDIGWYQGLLDFGINYLGETVDEMTLNSVKDYVLDHMPRKVSTDPNRATSIVVELAMFWQYLDRVYELPEAKSIVEWLKTDGLAAELEEELSDSSNYGMAKGMFMAGKNAGYDMTSEEGMAQFMMAYNESLMTKDAPKSSAQPTAARTTVAPITSGHRVGRNDPCPCGSGKKFKTCCH